MSTNQQPLVSILTPVYNGADYLAECIESVLNQSYQNYEYIIVNNCSKDGTLEIAKKYAAQDWRIRVHDNEKFVGVIENHNNAFNLMSPQAKYCKVVSGDDTIFPTCVEKMVAVAEANPSVGLIGCYQVSGDVVKWQGFRYPKSVLPGREVGRKILLGHQVWIDGQILLGFGSPTSLMYRSDLVRATPAFYPTASPHSDTSACFKSLQTSDFGFVYEILSWERTHEETQTSASQKINKYSSQTINDFQQYGPYYLSKQELEENLEEQIRSYRQFLAANYFMGARGKDFWDYHKTRMAELGYPLKRFTLFKAAVAAVLREAVNPKMALDKVRKRLAEKRASKQVAVKKPNPPVKEKLVSC